jgi:hypothetical protein
VRAWTRAHAAHVALALLALQFVAVGLWQAAHDAPTVDEAVDVASGVTSLVRHDLRLNPEHGPLPKVLSALPALAARPIVPDGEAYRTGDWFDHTDEFIRANRDAGRLDRVLFLARLVPIAEGVLVALLLFSLARRCFGEPAGWLAAGLWLTTPVFVGHAHFAMIDVPFTLATLLVCDALARFGGAPSLRRAGVVGAACAAALLTRHTALVLVAVAVPVVMAACWRHDRRIALRFGAATALVAFAGVWLVIRVIAPSAPSGAPAQRLDAIVATAQGDSFATRLALAPPFPLEFRAGLAYLSLTSEPRPAYAFGAAWHGARLWFFPAALLTKLPISGVLVLAAAPWAWRGLDRERRRAAWRAVVLPGGALAVFLLLQPLNLGLRYAFPVVALVFVAAGPVAVRLVQGRGRALGAALVATQLVAFWSAAPHALAWTAPPFQPAYRWVSDSNVDFGQDLYRVDAWAARQDGDVWTALLTPRGLSAPAGTRSLLAAEPARVTGWVAVSVTRLTVLDRDQLAWLRAYCPVGTIGGSVLLYHFDGAPDATAGPSMPASSCTGASFSTRRA